MPPRIVRSGFRRGSVRATDWAFAFVSTGFVNVGANTKTLLFALSSAVLSTLTPFTIIRTRGYFAVASDQQAATENQLGAIGVVLVNDTARALGVTGIPGPATDALWDAWFVHDFFGQRYNVGSNIGFDAQVATRHVIDSKAMRKVESDEGMVLMIENNSSTAFLISVGMRFLIKAG